MANNVDVKDFTLGTARTMKTRESAGVNTTIHQIEDSAGGEILGAKVDARSTATDTTAVGAMSVWKQISFSIQALVTAFGAALTRGSGAVDSNTQRVAIASDSAGVIATGTQASPSIAYLSTVAAGEVAHDAVDTGNPQKIGFKAIAGLSTATLVAAGDRTQSHGGLDGAQLIRPHCGLEDIVTGNATNTDGTSTSCIASSGGGIKTYLTSVVLCNTSAAPITVDIKDGSTTKVSLPLPANSGCIFNPPVPIPGTAATAWSFDPSAATSTVTCSMVGFKSKV